MMSKNSKKYFLPILVSFLLVFNIFLFEADWQNCHRGFTFAMLNVGQGDGLFIESPTGTHVLVDGGPPKSILGPLSQVMPPFAKNIDAMMITNPDSDHIGGFADVLKNYKVGALFEPGTVSPSKTYENLEAEIKKEKIPDILAKRGMRLDLGGGVILNILFPDRDVSTWATNDGSMMARLTYGNIAIMLTGDAPMKTERILLAENSPAQLKSNVLKVGHHGSRTSTSPSFVQAVLPTYALISDGKDNKYGHPHQETLDTLAQFGVKVFRTDQLGTIILKSDGDMLKWSYAR
jgi:competence protein ComEC